MQLAVPEVTDLDREPADDARAVRPRPRPRRPTSAAAACWPGGCSSAACASCSSSPAARSAVRRDQLGRPREHAAEPRPGSGRASTGRSPACSATCAAAACSTTRWCCSPPSSAARRSRSRRPNVVGTGRDHNQYGFSVWLAGAGLKHGIAYGATDEIGWKAVENAGPLARLPRHRAAPARHRPRAADVLPQRHPPPADERARARCQGNSRVNAETRGGEQPKILRVMAHRAE